MINVELLKTSFLDAIIAGLNSSASVFASIPKLPSGEIRVITGLSLELYPWHEYFALSLRDSEHSHNEYRYSPADWKYFEFVTSNESRLTEIGNAAKAMTQFYNSKSDPKDLQEMAHLIFIAGAEALLNVGVSEALRRYGIDCPQIADRFPENRSFEYMVLNSDSAAPFNYCEHVLANRITARLTGLAL